MSRKRLGDRLGYDGLTAVAWTSRPSAHSDVRLCGIIFLLDEAKRFVSPFEG